MKPKWTPIRVRLGQIKAWEGNPRMSTKAQAERIIKSETKFGQPVPFLLNPEEGGMYLLLDGHQRLSAWLTVYGAEHVMDAMVADRPLTEAEHKELIITLHTGATGEWNWQQLSGWNAGDLQSWGMNADTLKQWNNDANNLKELLKSETVEPVDAEPQIDRAAELQEKWQTATGQLWKLGEHRLLIGDCTVRENVERLMGGEEIDLVLTDPPYAVDYGAKNRSLNSIARSNRIEEDIAGDNLSVEETAEMLWKPAFSNAYNASRNGAVIYCFTPQGGDQMMMMMMMMMMKAEWNKRLHQLIWRKNAPTFSMGRLDYQYQHEPVLYTWKGTNHGYYGETGRSIIDCDRPSASKLHPTMKPVELFEIFIKNSSRQGENVYDPFFGSGTTLIAGHNLQRRVYGCELSEKYGAVILERFYTATGITPVLID